MLLSVSPLHAGSRQFVPVVKSLQFLFPPQSPVRPQVDWA
jgi:hypothetical protein